MQDINWPVAQALQPFLTAIGAPLAPAVHAVLAGNDDIWKYWLLEAVVRRSGSLALALKPELTAIAASDEARSDPDWRELRATAGEIIEKFDLADAPPLAR